MKICALIVTYQPPASVVGSVEALRLQLPEVIVVDNGSEAESAAVLDPFERLPGVEVIRNRRNLGLAAALNRGVTRALELGHDWIATFDQDSTVTPDFFKTMLAAHDSCPRREEVALISPVHHDADARGKLSNGTDTTPAWSFIPDAWTSGSLIKARAIQKVGGYDEALFVDYVDFDFCLRLRQSGFRLIRSHHSLLLHRLGTPERHSVLGFQFTLKSHRPARHYYMTRNRLIMFRRYATAYPLWALKETRWMIVDPAKILLFETDKRQKLRCLAKGWWDGLTCRCQPGAQLPALCEPNQADRRGQE